MASTEPQNSPFPLEDNLKKALTELLLLHLLSQRDYYIGELTATLQEKSDGALAIVFPYGAIYRLLESGYVRETEKRNAPDGRRRQYYRITDSGKDYLRQLISIYTNFSKGVDAVLAEERGGEEHD